jgi:hypothetical protein
MPFSQYEVSDLLPCTVVGRNPDSDKLFPLPLYSLERIWKTFTLFDQQGKGHLGFVHKFMSLANQLFGMNIYTETTMAA